MRLPALETDVQVPALLAKFTITVEAVVLPADVVVTARLSLRCNCTPWPLPWSGRADAGGVVQALTFLSPVFPANCLVGKALGICAGVHFRSTVSR